MTLNNEKTQFTLAFALSVLATASFTAFYEFRLINAMIVTHVILGVMAFLVGAITFLSQKGGKVHKVSVIIMKFPPNVKFKMCLFDICSTPYPWEYVNKLII